MNLSIGKQHRTTIKRNHDNITKIKIKDQMGPYEIRSYGKTIKEINYYEETNVQKLQVHKAKT